MTKKKEPQAPTKKGPTPSTIPFDDLVRAAERNAGAAVAMDLICAAVRAENGSRDAAAVRLGLTRRTFFRRCQELGAPLTERLAAIDAELRGAAE